MSKKLVIFFSIFLMIACVSLRAQSVKEYKPSSITKVIILGSGSPDPDPHRMGPCVAIVVNDKAYIVDAGVNCVRQAAALSQEYGGSIEALNPENLDIVFITHLHSDHTLGLPDLMNTSWVVGRNVPLRVYGPEGLKEMCKDIQESYIEDRYCRLFGLEPVNNEGWRVYVQEYRDGGVVYKDENITVEAIKTKHGSWPINFGYKFTTPDRVVLISGDTANTKSIREAAKGVDILVHECYQTGDFGGNDPKFEKDLEFWKTYMSEFHTSSEELANIANEAKPGLLILYHQELWSDDQEAAANEIRNKYKGEVISSKDLDIF
ncbi:MAG: MBL fold metallo-hydrolase [Candidatus Omnitrophota bacterium]